LITVLSLFSLCLFLVQGSQRDSAKQNKDLSQLTQQQHIAPSNNLNNPSATKNSAVTTTTDSDVNKSGPYFDVAASKNVRIKFTFKHFSEEYKELYLFLPKILIHKNAFSADF
jgi:hypothetical protein